MPIPSIEAPELYPTAVAYLDALGTSAASDDASLSTEFLLSLRAAFGDLESSLFAGRTLHRLDYQIFSDLVCLAAPKSSAHALQLVLRSVATVAGVCATNGIFVRGGVTFDDFFCKDNLIFGPAIVRAVRLERSTTLPRVALADEAAAMATELVARVDDSLPIAVDLSDGTLFVDYLDRVQGHERVQLRQHIARWVSGEDTPKAHVAKGEWLAAYYNWRTKTDAPLPTRHSGGFSKDLLLRKR